MARFLAIASIASVLLAAGAQEYRAGVGKVVITPRESIWLSGYASRRAPSEGKVHDLWAKAIAIEDSAGTRVVILTSDLIGLTRSISNETARRVEERFGIPRSHVMLTASHTHCGPVLRDNLTSMYGLDEEQAARVWEYSDALPGLFVDAISQALETLEPVELRWANGTAGFAVNRRQYTLDGVVIGVNPIGPVDHSVPALIARREDGSIKGVLFGYACHNTTLDFQLLCGDYAGFAQIYVENAIPGAVALFASGCGADANPNPRRTLALAEQHGNALGEEVVRIIKGETGRLSGALRAAFEEIPLRLTPAPDRAALEAQLESREVYVQRRTRDLIKTLDTAGAIPETKPYPIQVFQFGDTLQITALGGEVVVDYALLIKYELGAQKQFVIGYANDVMAYIPSLRVLREGGYEAETSMIYYGLHGPWDETIEQDIMGAVRRMSVRD